MALSLSSRTVGVTHHSVLRSPDFPLQTAVTPASRTRPHIRSDRLAHFGERECIRSSHDQQGRDHDFVDLSQIGVIHGRDPLSLMPDSAKDGTNPTELVSVVPGPLHYAE